MSWPTCCHKSMLLHTTTVTDFTRNGQRTTYYYCAHCGNRLDYMTELVGKYDNRDD